MSIQTSQHSSLHEDLHSLLGPRVRFDETIRGIHATDASHYQIFPLAVATPLDEAEVLGTLRICARHGLPVTPRGSATSLSGQTHGPGLVLDLSRHLDRILEINPQKGWARVQPGVIRDQLNAAAARHGLEFAPDPATTSRATIGGMIGNNSSGTRSIVSGITSDHLLSCRVALADGRVLDLHPRLLAEWENSPEKDLLHGLHRIIEDSRADIASRFPRVMRRVSGYALDAFLQDPTQEPWNLARLFCGSEGTLGVLLEATIRLVPKPRATCVVAIHHSDLQTCLSHIEPLLAFGPSAIELLDATVLREARRNPSTRDLADFILGEPAAMLLTEFCADTPEEATARGEALAAHLHSHAIGFAWPVLHDPAAQSRAWEVRRLGLGLITNVRGPTKGQAFIEDACIPLPHLPDYIRQVQQKCREEGVDLILYAHASVGVLHARPALNLHNPADIAKMRRIAEFAFSLCVRYGGCWAGEHGDGLVRGEFIPRFFGPHVYDAFRRVKSLFDPDNLMNPGKIVDSPPMTTHMRYQVAGYAQHGQASEKKAWFHYREAGGLLAAVEQCNGVGACRKLGSGVMCPSFMATREEKDSTRARANALRLAITGQLAGGNPDAALVSDGIKEVLDLCLGCKACKKECPNAVDVAKFKAEVLQKRHEVRGIPLGTRLVANLPGIAARLCGPWAPLLNWGQSLPPFRALLHRVANMDPRRPLPRLSSRSLLSRLGDTLHIGLDSRGSVALYIDSYTNAYEPEVGEAAIALLVGCGFRVHPLFVGDSQRARISKGLLSSAKRDGETLLRRIDERAPGLMPILCLEPSCASALKDDLPDLIDDVDLGRRVSTRIFLVDEFLHREKVPVQPRHSRILVHGHCHQKALSGLSCIHALLPNATLIDAGCCGMAGSFGFEHYDVSLRIGEDRLFPALRSAAPDTVTVASGFSCRHQIHDATGIRARHIVEVLAPA